MSATNEKRCEHGMPVGTDEACPYCQEPISPASAQCSAADFRIEQLTRALHIALRSRRMRILDLFAGLGGEMRRPQIEARGHEYVTLDLEKRFGCTITADILTQTPETLGSFDFIWASPPCEAFSVASIGHHWGGGARQYQPKTTHAVLSQKIVEHTVKLIQAINPTSGWMMENPRGVLRKLPCVAGLPRVTVSYCQYGDTRMKPTDLWGEVPNWLPRPMCKNGDPCHEAAPRGAKTGTQGIQGAAERAVVPWQLWHELLTAAERSNDRTELPARVTPVARNNQKL